MGRRKHEHSSGGDINMTPMIDVVFQLIIFFIVTVKMEKDVNPDIRLEDAPHGPIIKKEADTTMVVEVDRRGWISMHGAQLTPAAFEAIMKQRYRRHGEFPVLVRGDARAKHKHIRAVMDICTAAGIWRISFVAVQERKVET